jgi:hypothetical protein
VPPLLPDSTFDGESVRPETRDEEVGVVATGGTELREPERDETAEETEAEDVNGVVVVEGGETETEGEGADETAGEEARVADGEEERRAVAPGPNVVAFGEGIGALKAVR